MCWFWLNSNFITREEFTLSRNEIDEVINDEEGKKFTRGFHISLSFLPINPNDDDNNNINNNDLNNNNNNNNIANEKESIHSLNLMRETIKAQTILNLDLFLKGVQMNEDFDDDDEDNENDLEVLGELGELGQVEFEFDPFYIRNSGDNLL